MITNIHTVTLYVRDQDAARRFYVDVLGLEMRREADMGPMGTWLEVGPPGQATGFVLADATRFDKLDRVGSSADLVLHTDDVDGLRAKLTQTGAEVSEPEDQPWGRFVRVTDPDGHVFVVSEPVRG